MPTKTFFNLPKEKQEKIIDASIHEFSSVSFKKASINHIIKQAEISRGSFYMYFEDIQDLTIYIMRKIKQEILDEIRKRIDKLPIKLQEFMIIYHDIVFDYYNDSTYRNLFKNVMAYFQERPDKKIKSMKNRIYFDGQVDILISLLDISQFKVKEKEYIKRVIDLTLTMFRNVILKTVILDLNKEESKKILQNMLEILENGYGEDNYAKA